MLILSRRQDESIVIGDGDDTITIEVLSFSRSQGVRLGITAAPDVAIDRSEVRARKVHGIPPLRKPRRNGRA